VVACFVLSCAYLVALLVAPQIDLGPNILTFDEPSIMLYYNLSAIFVLYWPDIIKKLTRYEVSDNLLAMYYGFVFLGLLLGTNLDFYNIFTYYDFFLHFLSGIILGILGFAILDNAQRHKAEKIGVGVTATFAFAFSMASGKVWEVYEFVIDIILGVNTQRWADAYGVPFVGQSALANTMWDVIFNMLGAILVAFWGYHRIKHKGWSEKLGIKKI
jgi:VanZ family protein